VEVVASQALTRRLSLEVIGRHRYRASGCSRTSTAGTRGSGRSACAGLRRSWWRRVGVHHRAVQAPPSCGEVGEPVCDTYDTMHFFNGQVGWTFRQGTSIRVFAGGQRGGLRCVSGVCRVFPSFQGVKAEACCGSDLARPASRRSPAQLPDGDRRRHPRRVTRADPRMQFPALRIMVVFVVAANAYILALMAAGALLGGSLWADQRFSLRKYYLLMGWAPLAFGALALMVDPRYLVLFVAAGSPASSASCWCRCSGAPSSTSPSGPTTTGRCWAASPVRSISSLGGGRVVLPRHGTPRDLGLPRRRPHAPAGRREQRAFVIGCAVAWPGRVTTSARKVGSRPGVRALLPADCPHRARPVAVLRPPLTALDAGVRPVGFFTEYVYGRLMSLFFDPRCGPTTLAHRRRTHQLRDLPAVVAGRPVLLVHLELDRALTGRPTPRGACLARPASPRASSMSL